MKVLVAANLAPVRDLVAAACGAVDNSSAEYVSSLRDLDNHVAKSSENFSLIVLDGTLLRGAQPEEHVKSLCGRVDTPVAIALPEDRFKAQASRFVVAGAYTAFPHDFPPLKLSHLFSMANGEFCFAISRSRDRNTLPAPLERLSEREKQVLMGICAGEQNKEIAHGFSIKEVTVKMHVRAIIRKLGAKNRTHAAMIARDLGMCG